MTDETKTETGLRKMISMKEVLKLIPISRSTIERKIKDKTFPESYPIAPMRVGFFLDEVLQWQKDLQAWSAEKSAA